jgi:hypothetical protein
MRFANSVTIDDDGQVTADLSRLSLLEEDGTGQASPDAI